MLSLLSVAVFVLFVMIALLIDFFAHKNDEKISLKSAILWSIFWVVVSFLFGGYIYAYYGGEMAWLFFTGYALEKALSVDNLFVMMAIFAWFKVPDIYRHRVLYFGVLGAIVFRFIFVAIGTGLLSFGSWVEIIFALIIAWTAIVMLRSGDGDSDECEDYSQHFAYRAVYRIFPVYPKLFGHNFFINKKEAVGLGLNIPKWLIATPLFLCLVVVEFSDVAFAFDSVPAVIAVSREPLIIYSAMIFAILGLRSLYFVINALREYLVHLEKAVIFLLFFISAKLILNATAQIFGHGFEINAQISLIVVLVILTIGVLASLIFKEKEKQD